MVIVASTNFCGDRKTWRDWQANVGHARKVLAFAAENLLGDILPFRFDLTKVVNHFPSTPRCFGVLSCHDDYMS